MSGSRASTGRRQARKSSLSLRHTRRSGHASRNEAWYRPDSGSRNSPMWLSLSAWISGSSRTSSQWIPSGDT